MIGKPTAIKDDSLNALGSRLLSNGFANRLGLLNLSECRQIAAKTIRYGGDGTQSAAGIIINHLCINMF